MSDLITNSCVGMPFGRATSLQRPEVSSHSAAQFLQGAQLCAGADCCWLVLGAQACCDWQTLGRGSCFARPQEFSDTAGARLNREAEKALVAYRWLELCCSTADSPQAGESRNMQMCLRSQLWQRTLSQDSTNSSQVLSQ